METTLIILKPDAIQRGLMGEIIARFEAKGLQIVGAKLIQVTPELAAKHYAEHQGKPFYDGLVDYITSAPVMVLAIHGLEAIDVCRQLMGATNGRAAQPGTIRGDYSMSRQKNLVHGSDSPESAERELSIYFSEDELLSFERAGTAWSYDVAGGEID